MHANNITKVDLLDILFAGRNKEYGAYDLRKTYPKRLYTALVVAIVTISIAFAISVIRDRMIKSESSALILSKDISLTEMKADEPPPPPPPPPKINLPPPPPIATIAFTPPKIVKDEEVIKPPPEVKELQEAKIDVKTVIGTKDLGIISAPPSEIHGTQVTAAPVSKKEDEDKIFTKVEIDASFPGGTEGWTKYVQKAVEAHVDEFTEADFGTCVVRFVVDKTGKVSNVEATTMKNTKLEEIATNIIRKGPNWIPAQQNGRYVNAYRLQRVTVLNPNPE
jgi:protein TonB